MRHNETTPIPSARQGAKKLHRTLGSVTNEHLVCLESLFFQATNAAVVFSEIHRPNRHLGRRASTCFDAFSPDEPGMFDEGQRSLIGLTVSNDRLYKRSCLCSSQSSPHSFCLTTSGTRLNKRSEEQKEQTTGSSWFFPKFGAVFMEISPVFSSAALPCLAYSPS